MPGYIYKPKPPEPPPGTWRSIFGGHERTPFAPYPVGATVTEITRDQSDDARRRRIRQRKQQRIDIDLTSAEIDRALAELAAEEARITKEFYNG